MAQQTIIGGETWLANRTKLNAMFAEMFPQVNDLVSQLALTQALARAQKDSFDASLAGLAGDLASANAAITALKAGSSTTPSPAAGETFTAFSNDVVPTGYTPRSDSWTVQTQNGNKVLARSTTAVNGFVSIDAMNGKADATLRVSGVLPAGAGQAGIVMRRLITSNGWSDNAGYGYAAMVGVSATNVVTAWIERTGNFVGDAYTSTVLGAPVTLTGYVAGDNVFLEVTGRGGALSLTVWRNAETKPTSPLITVSSFTYPKGRWGFTERGAFTTRFGFDQVVIEYPTTEQTGLWGAVPNPQNDILGFGSTTFDIALSATYTTIQVPVRLIFPMNRTILLKWQLQNGDLASKAISGTDYTAAGGYLVFRPGEVEKFVPITHRINSVGKSLYINLSNVGPIANNANYASLQTLNTGKLYVQGAATATVYTPIAAPTIPAGTRTTGRTLVVDIPLAACAASRDATTGKFDRILPRQDGSATGGPGGTMQLGSYPNPGVDGRIQYGNGEVAPNAHYDTDFSRMDGASVITEQVNPHQVSGAGNLLLVAERKKVYRQSDGTGPIYSYSAPMVTTRKAVELRYGYVEVRAKFSFDDSTTVPAIWMLGNATTPPEVDIIELGLSGNRSITHALHYNPPYDPTATQRYASPNKAAFNIVAYPHTFDVKVFNNYGFEWTADWMIWYVNGVETERVRNTGFFDQKMWLLLNIAVGGLTTNPTSANIYPQTMEVEYARWYQSSAEAALN